nr:ATP-binding cassette domain-containing protein [Planctomycetota bacterium]
MEPTSPDTDLHQSADDAASSEASPASAGTQRAAATATAEPVPSGVFEAVDEGRAFDTATHDVMKNQEVTVAVEDFDLWYGEKQALYGINMVVPNGKVTALIGPSGCGKSTLIRCVNRMNDLVPSVSIKGDMLLRGDSVYGPSTDVIELRKRIGMVFQKPNPFPMTI